MNPERPIITFVCMNAYPLFDQSVIASIGGMETRAALLARFLAQNKEWRIRFIVGDFGQPSCVQLEDIEFHIYQPFHQRVSIKRLRNKRKRDGMNLSLWYYLQVILRLPFLVPFHFLPGIFYPNFWRSRKADIVCCFGNNYISTQVIADCHRLGIKTVLCIASDSDLAIDYQPDEKGLNDYMTPKWMAHYTLDTVDHIFVQTEYQQELLKTRFNRNAELIRNPVDIAKYSPTNWPNRSTRDIILWIGRSDTFHKQPLLLLELARRCPELPFLMIVNKTHAAVFDAIQTQKPHNLTVIESVPHPEIWHYYRRARVFVSTSAYEGFPNTFLQCAVSGVPIASLQVDPEEILSQQGCGLSASGSLEKLESNIRLLWEDTDLAEHYALTFYQYALSHHRLDSQANRFGMFVQKIIDTSHPKLPLPWWRFTSCRFVRKMEI